MGQSEVYSCIIRGDCLAWFNECITNTERLLCSSLGTAQIRTQQAPVLRASVVESRGVLRTCTGLGPRVQITPTSEMARNFKGGQKARRVPGAGRGWVGLKGWVEAPPVREAGGRDVPGTSSIMLKSKISEPSGRRRPSDHQGLGSPLRVGFILQETGRPLKG